MDLSFLYNDESYFLQAVKLTGNRYEAADLIQDVAEKLWRREEYHTLQPSEIRALARTVLRNKHFDNYEYKKGHDFRHVELTEAFDIPTKAEALNKLIVKEDLSLLFEKLKKINPQHKKILLMVANGATFKEVETKYKVPLNSLLTIAAKSRHFLKGERAEPLQTRKSIRTDWTEEDKQALRDLYYLGAQALSEKIDKPVKAIHNQAIKLNVKKTPAWPKHLEDILIKNFPIMSTMEVKKLLPSKTVDSIKDKAAQLGLTKISKWTAEQEETIKKHFGKKPISEIARMINKGETETKKKSQRMGLKGHNKVFANGKLVKSWTKKQKIYLVKHYTGTNAKELALHFKRTPRAIQVAFCRFEHKFKSHG